MNNISDRYDQINDFINGVATVIKDNLYGVIVYGGLEIIPPSYEYIGPFNSGIAVAIKNGQCVYIDLSENFYAKNGTEYVKLESIDKYDEVRDFHFGLACVRVEDKWGVIDTDGREVYSPQFYYISNFKHSVALIQKTYSSGWGFVNTDGLISEETYDDAVLTEDGNLITQIYEYSWGKNGRFIDGLDTRRVVLKNSEGKQLIPTDSELIVLPDWIHYARNPQNGLICAQNKNGEWGVINSFGEIIVPFQYVSIHDFQEQRTFAKTKDGNFILLSDTGNTIAELPKSYDKIEPFFHNVAKIFKNGLIGLIDREGNILLDTICNDISYCGNSTYSLSKNFIDRRIKRGYFNSSDKRTVLPFYDKIIKIWNEGAIVSVDIIDECTINYLGRPIIKNKTFSVILPSWCVAAKLVEDKYILCLSNGLKWGIIDMLGNVICNPIFDTIISFDTSIVIGTCFNEIMNIWGTGSGSYNMLYGAYNLNNRFLLKPEFYYMPMWEKNYYKIEDNKKFGIINSIGKQICKPIYDDVRWESNYFIVGKFRETWSSEKRYGLLDENGKTILSLYNEQIEVIADDVFKVKNRGKWYLYSQKRKLSDLAFSEIGDLNDELVIPVKYETKFGFINQRGELVIRNQKGLFIPLPKKFDWGNDFINGYATVWINGYENIVDSDFKLVFRNNKEIVYLPIKVQYLVQSISHNKFIVNYDGKIGVISKDGSIVINPEYESIDLIEGNKYIASIQHISDDTPGDRRYGIIKGNQKIVVPYEYSRISRFGGKGSKPLEKRERWYGDDWDRVYPEPSVYNKESGDVYLLCETAEYYNKNLNIISYRYGLMNMKGEIVLPVKYSAIIRSRYLYFVKNEYGKWGMFDLEFCQISDFKYQGIKNINDDLFEIIVITDSHFDEDKYDWITTEKCGIINKFGKEVIPPIYDSISVKENEDDFILELDGKESKWTKEFDQL